MYEHSLIGYKNYLKDMVAWIGYENYLKKCHEHYLHHDGVSGKLRPKTLLFFQGKSSNVSFLYL